jgi:hypothetical protein
MDWFKGKSSPETIDLSIFNMGNPLKIVDHPSTSGFTTTQDGSPVKIPITNEFDLCLICENINLGKL